MEIVALVVAVVALLVGGLALRRVDVVEARVRRWLPQAGAVGGAAAAAAAAPGGAASSHGVDPGELTALHRRIDELSAAAAAPAPAVGLSRVAVVRYDAFEDLGGRLSFSAAVLDDAGRGFVLTAIHGRSETRSYLKQVPPPGDTGQRELSPEERQAVGEAMKRQGP